MKADLAKLSVAVLLAVLAGRNAAAASLPDYRDDRSTPEAVVSSLYNAIDRKEYLRAWSYFREGPDRPDYQTFVDGYRNTENVRLREGKSTSDGAAGSIFYLLPVAIEAEASDGGRAVFEGCYELRLVQPSIQATPPFEPMGIVKGKLKTTSALFADAMGSCDSMQ